MTEGIRPLTDFFDPAKAASMAMMAGRLRNQDDSEAIQRDKLVQQQMKTMMDERRQSLKEAIPMMPNDPNKVKAMNELLNLGGSPDHPQYNVKLEDLQADGGLWTKLVTSDDPEDQDAAFSGLVQRNPSVAKVAMDARSKQKSLIGYGQFLEAAGLPNNEGTRQAVADSGAMQNQLGQAAMESPTDLARREEIQAKTKANQLKIAGMNVGAKVLLEGMAPVTPIIELGDRYLPKMEALTKAGERGLAYQGGQIARAGDPQFGAYLDGLKERRIQALDEMGKIYDATGNLQRIKDLHTQANEPLPRGETLETINAKLQSYNMLKDLRDAEVQYYGTPNATTLKAVKDARDAANGQMQNWSGQKQSLDAERIGLTKNAQALQREKFTTKQSYESNVALGQSELLDAKAQGGNLDQAAASIARKYRVKPSDLKSALEDPTKKGTMNVNLLSPGQQENQSEETTMVGQINELLADYNPGYVGVIDARVGQVGQMTATLSQARESWLQRSRALLTDIRHSKFGASLTENELKAALSELPNESMGDKQWPAAAKAWRDKWGKMIDTRVKVARQSRGLAPTESGAPSKPATAEDYLKSLGLGGK